MSGREGMTTRRSAPGAWAATVVAVLVMLTIGLYIVYASAETREPLLSALPFVLTLTVFLAVGWLLAARMPRHPLGWLLMAIPALFVLQAPFGVLGTALVATAPDAAAWLLWVGGNREDTWTWIPPVGLLFTQIPLRIPDGRLPSTRWRWFSWFTVATIVATSALASASSAEVGPGIPNPVYIAVIGESPWLLPLFGGLLAVSFLGSIASLFARYRHSDAVVRAQLRWVLWGTAIPIAGLILSWFSVVDWRVVNDLVLITYGFIPVSIAVAVLRYRLYDIDRIISRTAAYALVSVVVAGVYAVVVTSVTWLLPTAPSVAVAAATLAAAALFLPALRWIRARVDRRFDRGRYDAARVVESFGQRLRTGADPHGSASDLVDAVERTLQPTSVGLWTREGVR